MNAIRISIDETASHKFAIGFAYRWQLVSLDFIRHGQEISVPACLDAIKKALADLALGPKEEG